MEESKRYGKALSEYQSLAAQGKAPRKIILDKNGRPTYKTILFDEYHQLPKFDTERKTLIPGIYNPLRGAGNHEEFVKQMFANEINEIVTSISPEIKTINGQQYIVTGYNKGQTPKQIHKMVFNDDGTLTEKGKKMVAVFRGSPFLREELGDENYTNDTTVAKYLESLLIGEVFKSTHYNYNSAGNSDGSSNKNLINPIQITTKDYEYTNSPKLKETEKDGKLVNSDDKLLWDLYTGEKDLYKEFPSDISLDPIYNEALIDENEAERDKYQQKIKELKTIEDKYRRKYPTAFEYAEKEGKDIQTILRAINNFEKEQTIPANRLYTFSDPELQGYVIKSLTANKSNLKLRRLKEGSYKRDKGLIDFSMDKINPKNINGMFIDFLKGKIIFNTATGSYGLELFKEEYPENMEDPTPTGAIASNEINSVLQNAHIVAKKAINTNKEKETIKLKDEFYIDKNGDVKLATDVILTILTDPVNNKQTLIKSFKTEEEKTETYELNGFDGFFMQTARTISDLANPYRKEIPSSYNN